MARQPDYKLSLFDKHTERKNPEAGAAWLNDNGSINIQLNLGVVINSSADLVVTLWLRDDKKPVAAKKTSTRRYSSGKEVTSHDDSIPF